LEGGVRRTGQKRGGGGGGGTGPREKTSIVPWLIWGKTRQLPPKKKKKSLLHRREGPKGVPGGSCGEKGGKVFVPMLEEKKTHDLFEGAPNTQEKKFPPIPPGATIN